MLNLDTIDMTINGLTTHYNNGDVTPRKLIHALLAACKNDNVRNPAWIHLLSIDEIEPYLAALDSTKQESLPLYGIPFAIKDNIDLAGIPTTAACSEFAYTPEKSAFVVEQLISAGAIPLGKTNMDQFATGLVGVRSPAPWGPCKNTLNSAYISGGSSSGSAVAVATGRASFSLGTDTAGSGRVPASLNNIVGLKPSHGLLSTRGVVPACRSLDCVSIFALTCDDANQILDVAAQLDAEDPYSRPTPYSNSKRYFNRNTSPVIGVPSDNDLAFFGNDQAKALFQKALQTLKESRATLVPIDFSPFQKAAKLLYEGPWVAERYLAIQTLIETQPEALLPVIRNIIEPGNQPLALDAFKARYLLQAYAQQAQQQLQSVDAIVTPTNGNIYTIDQVLNDPIQLNSNLGYYTNFMNLLDCAGISVPSGFYDCGVGFGITLFHKAMSDKRLLSIAAAIQQHTDLPMGALTVLAPKILNTANPPKSHIAVVVCGAHLDGLPLNWQLKERGATLLEKTQSAPHYQLYALAGGPPYRPGMVRCEQQGAAIDVEVWNVPADQFGSFVAEIPQPLGIGKVQLADGRWESGFICEAIGIEGAKDITHFSSWKAYMNRSPA